MPTPASRLQVKLHPYESNIQDFAKFEAIKGGNEEWDPLNVAWLLQSDSEWVANFSYLAGNTDVFTRWSRIAAESVVYLLFGDWRKIQKHDDGTIDPDRWFQHTPAMPWVMYLERGLCWAATGGHWELVDKLLSFPTAKIAPDDDGRAAHSYYLGLAAWWGDPKNLAGIKAAKELGGAGSKAYHLLCDAVAAIAAADKPSVEKALDQYVKLFLKRRDHDEQFPLAATFLWYAARRKGVSPELPEETGKYIFLPLEES